MKLYTSSCSQKKAMKILQVNKFHYPRGGADQYFLDLARRQAEAGHEVAVFSMDHPKNLPTPWARYFVSRLSFNDGRLLSKLRAPGRMLYSFEAKRKFRILIDDFQPDIIHCHNIYHQLSPSILDVARVRKIPVVMHLHDYKLISANHAMYAPGPGGGHHCRPGHYAACLRRRCVKDSLAATLLAILEMWLHHSVLKIYERCVTVFIAPSRFMKETVVSYGQPEEKVRVIYNPVDKATTVASPGDPAKSTDDYLLYFGRLSPEKGVETLIAAVAKSGDKLKIAGAGESSDSLKMLAVKSGAPVEFLDFMEKDSLWPLISGARAIVLPSIWGENMPLSLLEAMNAGKIVIASAVGGLPEIIHDGVSGLLFRPGDVVDLVRQIRRLESINVPDMERRAREAVTLLTPERNLDEVMSLYEEILQ